jgi:hypothetical protein
VEDSRISSIGRACRRCIQWQLLCCHDDDPL